MRSFVIFQIYTLLISKHLFLKTLRGDSGKVEKLYFYIYESPNKVVDSLPVTIKQDPEDLKKTLEPLEFETLVRKIGFNQR